MYKSCRACAGLFIKSSGKVACECNVGYNYEIGDANKDDVGILLNGPVFQHIRNNFKAGKEPYDRCSKCSVKYTDECSIDNGIDVHIEPINACQLACHYCLISQSPPKVKTILPFNTVRKIFVELLNANIKVNTIIFVGYGEPLLNQELPHMIQFARNCYPSSIITVDTNGNFPTSKAMEIGNCGASIIKLSVDGVDQMSYVQYRKKGDFKKAIEFMRALNSCKNSQTKLIWKYILFSHNDSDGHIREALRMSKEIGIEILFDITCSANCSRRPLSQIRNITGPDVKFTCSLDKKILYNFLADKNYMKKSFPIENLDIDIQYIRKE